MFVIFNEQVLSRAPQCTRTAGPPPRPSRPPLTPSGAADQRRRRPPFSSGEMAAIHISSRAARVVLSMVVLACALCASVVTAQVNFSPSWGKRASMPPQQEACKPSMDSLMYLYKLIQDEAQKLTDCEKFAN